MENICYILGAGFSAPAGLPVMSDFLLRSRDLYFQDPEKYAHFEPIFNKINQLSITKNYFKSNLFNIEEIFSIVEMERLFTNEGIDFASYIKDVVDHFTPEIEPPGAWTADWKHFIFARNKINRWYGYFVGSLFQTHLTVENEQGASPRKIMASAIADPKNSYAVITLNYDRMLEKSASYIKENFTCQEKLEFNRIGNFDFEGVPLLKLHGSTDSEDIIPPTWAKNSSGETLETWKQAFEVLQKATRLRFVGYSLPLSDNYITYLLKTALVEAEHVKSIDVICLDPGGDVERRYQDFITFPYFRFANSDVSEYLTSIMETYEKSGGNHVPELSLNQLENIHETFMEKNAS